MRICLINMPFASPEAPSIALTQLKSVLGERFGECVSVEVLYLNLDFIAYAGGLEDYRRMTTGLGRLAGVSDWFFRAAAFPEAPDNLDSYLERFYFDGEDRESWLTRQFILEKRPGLPAFLDALIDKHRLAEADVVGFTAMFYQTVASFAMAQRIKGRNPGVVTAIGGAACEAEMGLEIAGSVEAIDFVFSGAALISFPEFIARQLEGDAAGCETIDGVFSKHNLGSCMARSPCGEGLEAPADSIRPTGAELDINTNVALDYAPFLDRFEETFPDGEVRPMLMFETSRGCSWGEKIACTFCGLNGTAMRYRSMAPAKAIAQIQRLFDYLPRCQFFLAVDTIVPKEYFDQVFPELETPAGAAMMYEVRPTPDEAQLETLVRAGVYVIQPGIESLATSTLKLMHKGTTAFGNIRFLKLCSQYPLHVEWNLLIGSPGEDEATYQKYLRDLPLLTHLHPPTGAFPISFDRFSQYFIDQKAHGVELRPQEYYAFAYPFAPQGIANLAYHFIDANSQRERIDAWVETLNDVVARWWSRWENRDGGLAPKLEMLRDGTDTTIYDSRTGVAKDYAISRVTAELLEYLDKPKPHAQVASKFGDHIAEEQLAILRDKGLLFEERERLMSLVLS